MTDRVQLLTAPVLMISTGYEPLFQTTWKRALTAVFGGRAEIIETHEKLTIGTVAGPYPFPAIVRFTTGVIAMRIKNINKHARLTRRSLYLRDEGECQYCYTRVSFEVSTIDHVRPRSRGGTHVWENVVLACVRCNQIKGSDLPREAGMNLKHPPVAPTINKILRSQIDLNSKRALTPSKLLLQ